MLQYRVSLPTVQAKGGTAIPKHTHLSLDLLFTCYLPLYNHLLTYIISECSLCQDGHATWLAETRNAHRILEGNPLRYRLQGDLENVGECDHVGCEGKILQWRMKEKGLESCALVKRVGDEGIGFVRNLGKTTGRRKNVFLLHQLYLSNRIFTQPKPSSNN